MSTENEILPASTVGAEKVRNYAAMGGVNRYLLTQLAPINYGGIRRPDVNMTSRINKGTKISSTIPIPSDPDESTPTVLLIFTPHNLRTRAKYFFKWPEVGIDDWAWVADIREDQDLADNYVLARLISGAITLESNTVTPANLVIQGVLNATQVQEIPPLSEISHDTILSYKRNDRDQVPAGNLTDGIMMLAYPDGDGEFHVPKTNAVSRWESPLSWDPLGGQYSVIKTTALGVPLEWSVDVPFYYTGAFKINYRITDSVSLDGVGVYVRPETYRFDVQTDTASFVPLESIDLAYDRGTLDVVSSSASHVYVPGSVTASPSWIANSGGPFRRLTFTVIGPVTNFKLWCQVEFLEMYKGGVSGPGSLITVKGAAPATSLTIGGAMNYEAVPNYSLAQNLTTSSYQAGQGVIEDINRANEFIAVGFGNDRLKFAYRIPEYAMLLANDDFVKYCQRQNIALHAAGIMGVLGGLARMAGPILGGLVGGPMGSALGGLAGNMVGGLLSPEEERNAAGDYGSVTYQRRRPTLSNAAGIYRQPVGARGTYSATTDIFGAAGVYRASGKYPGLEELFGVADVSLIPTIGGEGSDGEFEDFFNDARDQAERPKLRLVIKGDEGFDDDVVFEIATDAYDWDERVEELVQLVGKHATQVELEASGKYPDFDGTKLEPLAGKDVTEPSPGRVAMMQWVRSGMTRTPTPPIVAEVGPTFRRAYEVVKSLCKSRRGIRIGYPLVGNTTLTRMWNWTRANANDPGEIFLLLGATVSNGRHITTVTLNPECSTMQLAMLAVLANAVKTPTVYEAAGEFAVGTLKISFGDPVVPSAKNAVSYVDLAPPGLVDKNLNSTTSEYFSGTMWEKSYGVSQFPTTKDGKGAVNVKLICSEFPVKGLRGPFKYIVVNVEHGGRSFKFAYNEVAGTEQHFIASLAAATVAYGQDTPVYYTVLTRHPIAGASAGLAAYLARAGAPFGATATGVVTPDGRVRPIDNLEEKVQLAASIQTPIISQFSNTEINVVRVKEAMAGAWAEKDDDLRFTKFDAEHAEEAVFMAVVAANFLWQANYSRKKKDSESALTSLAKRRQQKTVSFSEDAPSSKKKALARTKILVPASISSRFEPPDQSKPHVVFFDDLLSDPEIKKFLRENVPSSLKGKPSGDTIGQVASALASEYGPKKATRKKKTVLRRKTRERAIWVPAMIQRYSADLIERGYTAAGLDNLSKAFAAFESADRKFKQNPTSAELGQQIDNIIERIEGPLAKLLNNSNTDIIQRIKNQQTGDAKKSSVLSLVPKTKKKLMRRPLAPPPEEEEDDEDDEDFDEDAPDEFEDFEESGEEEFEDYEESEEFF